MGMARSSIPYDQLILPCRRIHRGGVQAQTKGPHDFQHRAELRIAVRRQRPIKAFSSNASLSRKLAHAFGAGDVAERFGDDAMVAVLQGSLEVSGDVAWVFEQRGVVISSCPDFLAGQQS